MKARYAGSCSRCGGSIHPGDSISPVDRSWVHTRCDPREVDYDPETAEYMKQKRRDEAELAAGKAEVEQIQAISKAGSALREQLYLEMEQAAYNRGEDY
jgi:hypothetical protein